MMSSLGECKSGKNLFCPVIPT
ncbi:unnamed protein product [Spirodela intermedia]|uniref:Uncharacterized protein n=1 Tax=Spirodela intermedia TaxID=51605 RepID=A0A7I8JLV7_SPIIN|nr:unnamed protein product [Spirodela intermedia]CAA6670771.1 unnamed protein product [Spirodela intermedia]